MILKNKFESFIAILICLNVIVVMLETVDRLYFLYHPIFNIFDTLSVAIFTLEYIIRIYYFEDKSITGRIRYIISPLAIIDSIAIIPFYLPMIIHVDLRFLRLLRLLRILKILRYSKSLKLFEDVIRAKKDELVITTILIFMLLIISSSMIYFVEHDAQPDVFSSIPASMWWGVITLTTIGYGDTYPITPLGKFLGAIVSLLGICVFALPTGILGAGFIEQMQKTKKRKVCPHCGKDIE